MPQDRPPLNRSRDPLAVALPEDVPMILRLTDRDHVEHPERVKLGMGFRRIPIRERLGDPVGDVVMLRQVDRDPGH